MPASERTFAISLRRRSYISRSTVSSRSAVASRWPITGALTNPSVRFVSVTALTSVSPSGIAGLTATYPIRSPASERVFEKDPSTTAYGVSGSMGGTGALLYSIYGRRTPAACAANGPACDALDMYKSAPDFTRTLFNAVAHYDCGLEEALASLSTVRLVDRMPRIPYYIVHTDMDEAIPIGKHSDVLVPMLRARGYDVTYSVVRDRRHCDLPIEDWNAMVKWVIRQVKELHRGRP